MQQTKIVDSFQLKPLAACIRLALASGMFLSTLSAARAELPVPARTLVTSGAASTKTVGETMTIQQSSDKAVLNWQSFNVGAKNRVDFQQPSSSSIALNRINDNDPSKILGAVSANGQVYLYNGNGFVFGKDSVVNTNSVVASTLAITDEAFKTGISQQVKDDGTALPSLGQEGVSANSKAAITIEKGAKLHVGKDGLLVMAAPTVTNNGTLSAGNYGQVILVASKDKVYLQATDKNSPFHGLLVEVDTGGKVTNAGDILAKQGNVTLEGFAVNQQGRITATTSVNENGSIRLLAQEQHSVQSGKIIATKTTRDTDLGDGLGKEAKVTLGKASSTQVIADSQDGGVAIDAQAQRQSVIDIVANKIDVQTKATLKATGGKINAIASDDLTIIQPDGSVIIPPSGADGKQHTGRIVVAKDANIDVSGSKHISVPVSRNVQDISVQSYELRDAPNQKTGVLKGATISVDIRKETTIVDTSGAKDRVERSIAERLSKGGEIHLITNGDTIVNSGANIDISGGSVDYQSGTVSTTQLVTDYGSLVDISSADPKEHYAKIANNRSLFEQGYTEGQSAGAISIQTPVLAWQGNLQAGSVAGRNQRALEQLPFGGAFLYNQQDSGDLYLATQNVRFSNSSNPLALGIDDSLSAQNSANLVLPADLINESGVQDVVVKTSGAISLEKNTHLTLAMGATPPSEVDASNAALKNTLFAGTNNAPAGYLALDGASINIEGSITAPSGTVDLTTHFSNSVPANTLGKIDIAKTAHIDVSGRWVNDLYNGFASVPTEPLAIAGGTVKMSAIGDVTLQQGAKLNADAGAWLELNNTLTQGQAGTIDLSAVDNGSTHSLLTLDGAISAYGLVSNGQLNLTSSKLTLGVSDTISETGITPLVLHAQGNNFAWSGFSQINLSSKNDALVIKDNTQLNLSQENRWLKNNFAQMPSGASLAALTYLNTLPDYLRHSVALTLAGLTGVELQTGSSIIADTHASIALSSAQGGIYVDGAISAPAGDITLSLKADPNIVDANPAQAIWLGSHAQLQASGTVVMKPLDNQGRRQGEVLAGGAISLLANRGYVLQESGASIETSGTKAILDLPVDAVHYKANEVGSNAGKVTLAAGEGIVLNGTLTAQAGTQTTAQGRLDFTLDRTLRNLTVDSQGFNLNPAITSVSQSGAALLDSKLHFGDALPDSMSGKATLSSDLVKQGQFSDVRINNPDEIRFVGDVQLNAAQRLDLNTSKISADGGSTQLSSAYLRLGSELGRNNIALDSAPIAGSSQLTTQSQWTDVVGATRWDSFKNIALNSQHDLRAIGVRIGSQRDFVGALTTAANLQLSASQVYPTTLTNFSFTIDKTISPEGKISIDGHNTDTSPLSANGVLNFNAPTIAQNGVLKAPFGTINLNADKALSFGAHSVTTVSAKGQTIPFGITQGGLNWLYPLDSAAGNLVFNSDTSPLAIQTKQLNFTAPQIDMEKGSLIDVSGGGDMQAYEFQTGAGGTNDYLAAISPSIAGAYNGGFAIVPTLGSALAPYDPAQQDALTNLSSSAQANFFVGSQVYLTGSANLPAGTYTILPPRYALLQGAFLVTPQANSLDNRVNGYTKDNLAIVSGYQTVAGTNTQESRWHSFLIEQGTDIRKNAQYDERTANSFFTDKATSNETSLPAIPKDSGQIALNVDKQLVLAGQISSSADADGRGAKVDIAASNISVVDKLTTNATSLEILDTDLTNLNLDSLLLGGIRTADPKTAQTNINVTANSVSFANNVAVSAKDLLITAKEAITVNSGVTLSVSDKVNTGDSLLTVQGDGALLRLSGDKQVKLQRTDSTGVTGDLLIAKGATLTGATLSDNSNALESAMLNASNRNTLAGDLKMNGGSLTLDAKAIALGEVSQLNANSLNTNADSLNLSNSQLAAMNVDALQLNSQQAISLVGKVSKADGSPLQFGELTIDAAGLVGINNAAKTASLQADSLVLQNTRNAPAPSALTGKGALTLASTHFTQGTGAFAINGFNTTRINVNAKTTGEGASQTSEGGFINADGQSQLQVGGDLHLTSDYVTATGGSTLAIDASGHQVSFDKATAAANTPSNLAFGGSLSVLADGIAINNTLALPSGQVTFVALKDDVSLGATAKIDLAGRAVQFADTNKYTTGGSFSAGAVEGSVNFAKGSQLNLNAGADTVAGGTLSLSAPKRSVNLSGTLQANNGSADIDVANLDAGFDNLITTLNNAGINNTLTVRSRRQDISQRTAINAKNVTLVSDTGNIDVAGKINATDGDNGGTISLYAANHIGLLNGGQLNATGTTKGGKVLLSAVDSDAANDISLAAGSQINVRGGSANQGGTVILRAARSQNSLAIDPIKGTVTGYQQFYADAVKQYTNNDFAQAGAIGSADIAQIKSDTQTYMDAASAANVSAAITLRPSIAIHYDGDLTLQSNWDFADWRYNGAAGSLAVAASGQLNLASSVSDGFSSDNHLLSGASWSYQWVAGADLKSADTLATAHAKSLILGKDEPALVLDENGIAQVDYNNQLVDAFGNPVFDAFTGNAVYNRLYSNNPDPVRSADGFPVADLNNPVIDEFGSQVFDVFGNPVYYYLYDSAVHIRTGSGDIQLVSGSDILFKNAQTAVYNAGRPDDSNRYGNLGIDNTTGVDYGSELAGAGKTSEYPIAGGDIAIKAARNIQGAVSSQFIKEWLPRQGDWGDGVGVDGNSKTPSAWGVVMTEFKQNIASFAGGNVSIDAQGSVTDLSVMMPTTGKQVGEAYADHSINPSTNMPNFLTNKVAVNGGGQLQVSAGVDIAGGAYLLGQGSGAINAGGKITGGTQFTNGPQLIMGDGTFNLNALQGVSISGVSDVMSLSNVNQFYSYGEQSGVTVNALSGDIQLGADTSVIRADNLLALSRAGDEVVTNVYPASLQTTAFGGSIALDAINLFPAAVNKIELLAQQAITNHLNGGVALYDVDKSLLPSKEAPKTTPAFSSVFGLATTPPPIMHANDTAPARIISQQGDISNVAFNLSKHAIIQAGRDFNNLSIAIQNINASDVSLLAAGRDIKYSTTVNDIGILERPVDSQKIEIAGPGNVLVKTGRNLDLGAANGLLTVGNKNNANLPVNGANLNVLVGLNGHEPNYSGFINYVNSLNAIKESTQRNERFNEYLNQVIKENKANPNFTAAKQAVLEGLVTTLINTFDGNVSKINQTITDFMRQRLGNNALSQTEALTQFDKLNPADYLLIQPQLNVLISQIFFNELKIASNSVIGNENGFKVIDLLFPKNTWQGDLSLILSGLETIQGGDINLFVPGGNINAGLAFAFPGLEQKKASDLGIIAQGDGSVNAFVQNNFEVNQSRVFTQGKGDILVWSGAGDVDAGRGSKSSLAVPETLVTYKDEQKNTLIQPAVSGSGIRAADLNGNVYLVAPKGVVNAGEAGIGATNVTISATAVLGSGNIQVGGGTSSGVASVAAPPPASAGASNTAASVAQSAQSSVTNTDDADSNKRKKRGKLIIKLLGFG